MQFSVINFSEVNLHPDYRWDGEYLCSKPYKNVDINYVTVGEVLLSTQYGLSIKMNEEGNGKKIYRMNEISNMMCERNILKYAPISEVETARYLLKDKDVLFNRTNSQLFVGRTGIFRSFSDEPFVFASYLVRMVPNSDMVTPEYLTAFLNTSYGILDVKRRARASINQSNVNAEELKRVEIPLVSRELQEKITKIFDQAFKLIQESEFKFKQSQDIILPELGLSNWQPKHQPTFIKNYSDTQTAERIDAEYYQPKYESLIKAIQRYSGGCDELKNLTTIKDKNFEPKDKKQYKYIELANIAERGEIRDCMVEMGQDLPTRARRKVSTGDVIVSSIEGSLSSIAIIEKQLNNGLCSTGFHVVEPTYFNSETLFVLMKSFVGQIQLKKGCSGTILTSISKEEVEKITLPKIQKKKQKQIQQKITKTVELREKSKLLLNVAKQAVEIAIEKDEKSAIKWLKEKTKNVK